MSDTVDASELSAGGEKESELAKQDELRCFLESVLDEQGIASPQVEPFLKKMHENLIFSSNQLMMLHPDLLQRLQLPIALENGIYLRMMPSVAVQAADRAGAIELGAGTRVWDSRESEVVKMRGANNGETSFGSRSPMQAYRNPWIRASAGTEVVPLTKEEEKRKEEEEEALPDFIKNQPPGWDRLRMYGEWERFDPDSDLPDPRDMVDEDDENNDPIARLVAQLKKRAVTHNNLSNSVFPVCNPHTASGEPEIIYVDYSKRTADLKAQQGPFLSRSRIRQAIKDSKRPIPKPSPSTDSIQSESVVSTSENTDSTVGSPTPTLHVPPCPSLQPSKPALKSPQASRLPLDGQKKVQKHVSIESNARGDRSTTRKSRPRVTASERPVPSSLDVELAESSDTGKNSAKASAIAEVADTASTTKKKDDEEREDAKAEEETKSSGTKPGYQSLHTQMLVEAASSGERSQFWGLTPASKDLIRSSWEQLQVQPIQTIARFFERMYQRIVANDPVARHVFHGGGLKPPKRALQLTISFIVSMLDQPESVHSRIYRMGVIHMIMGVQERNFATFQRDFIRTLEEFLGHDYLPLEAKEAWIALIQCIVKLMLEEYTRLAKGVSIGWVQIKLHRRWKPYFATMTHNTIRFHKSDTVLVPKFSIDLTQYLNEVVQIPNRHPDPSSFKFAIVSSQHKSQTLSVATAEDRDHWISELQLRLRPIDLVRQGDIYRRSVKNATTTPPTTT